MGRVDVGNNSARTVGVSVKQASKDNKREQKNRKKWLYINVLREHNDELQKIADTEGRRLNITNAKDMLQLIIAQIIAKYKEARNYEDMVENVFLELSPTAEHYQKLEKIIVGDVKEYLKELKKEQERRERARLR